MRVPGMGRIKKAWQSIMSQFRHKVIILLYHRVFKATLDPQLLCVTPENFASHMEHLRRNYIVLSLTQLQQMLVEENLPRKAVVVTFDDGYADNLWNAKPILEMYEVPATIFITTGYIGKNS